MELTRKTFDELAAVIHRICGLVVGSEKAYLVRHRLEPLVKRCGCEDFEGLVKELRSIGGHRLHDAIIEAITTKETSFFRDAWFFETLGDEVLGKMGATGHRRRLRIWSAACATGQEPYSVAMLAREMGEPGGALEGRPVSILGTDLSDEALKVAKAAVFTAAQVKRGLSDTRLRQHFRKHHEHWQVQPEVQQAVVFRRMDLLKLPADLGQFDLVLCRNVLIYFDLPTRERVIQALVHHLEPGGWLALGAAESLYGVNDRMEMVKCGRAVLYRKPAKGF